MNAKKAKAFRREARLVINNPNMKHTEKVLTRKAKKIYLKERVGQ